MKARTRFLSIITLLLSIPICIVIAHSGKTDSRGCHWKHSINRSPLGKYTVKRHNYHTHNEQGYDVPCPHEPLDLKHKKRPTSYDLSTLTKKPVAKVTTKPKAKAGRKTTTVKRKPAAKVTTKPKAKTGKTAARKPATKKTTTPRKPAAKVTTKPRAKTGKKPAAKATTKPKAKAGKKAPVKKKAPQKAKITTKPKAKADKKRVTPKKTLTKVTRPKLAK